MALSKYWINHIEAWQSSGVSQAAYCRQHQLNAKSFSGRISELRAQGLSEPIELIPVQVKAEEYASLVDVQVLTVEGGRLELPTTVSAPWLGDLLRCLS